MTRYRMKKSPRISYSFFFALGVIGWCVVMTCLVSILVMSSNKAGNPWWISLLWNYIFLPADLLRGSIGRWGEFVSVVSWHLLWAMASGLLVAKIFRKNSLVEADTGSE